MNKKIVHTVVEHIAETYPGKTAIRQDGVQVSYRQLNDTANRFARVLQSLGVRKGDIVGVLGSQSVSLVQSVLAIFKSAAVYLPVDTSQATERIVQIFTDCRPTVLIVGAAAKETVQSLITEHNFAVKYLLIPDAGNVELYKVKDKEFVKQYLDIDDYSIVNPELVSEPDDSNYIFYTSGSTGTAKAILGCNKGLGHFINWEIGELGLDQHCVVSCMSQFTFDASLRDIFIPLCTGGTLCIPSADTKNNTVQLLEWIEENKISLVHCVPSVFRMLLKELKDYAGKKNIARHLHYVLMAGEPLYAKDILGWREQMGDKGEIINLYGTSETTMAKTFHRIGELPADPAQALHVGKPISNAMVAIFDGSRPCDPGEIGEIYIKTPFMTKGYYNNEQLTREIFVQNPLVTDREDIMHKTGDFGRYREDGNIEVLGRKDEQVKVNGIRVELGEIRQKVLAVPGVNEVEILAVKNDDLNNDLLCYYTGQSYEADQLRQLLEKTLNRNVTPGYFIYLEKFPLTINGKVDKRALPKPEDYLIKDKDYEAPANDMERSLEAMCRQILGLSRVDRNISFFRIGGTSLKAMQYISAIYKKYGVSVNLRDIFEKDTIAALAAFILRIPSAGNEYREIAAIETAGHYELSHAQKRLWLTDQFQEEKLRYNMSFVSQITGALQVPVLEKAISTIIDRHEILRTTFTVIEGSPRQEVHTGIIGPAVNYIDIRNYDNKKELAAEIINEELTYSFDLQTGPLLRVTLAQTAAKEFNLILSMHHIVSDGWSVEIFVKELFTLYESYSKNTGNPLAPLRIQYKDFAAWQNGQLSGSLLEKLEGYWLTRFNDNPSPVMLPTDFSPNNQLFLNGGMIEFELDETHTEQVNRLAEKNEASTFMVLMALVNVLLNRYTGQQDIVIGTPAATRSHPDLENQIGIYINVLPVRTAIKTNKDRFADVLSKVKQNLLGAVEHDLYPYDLLIEKLGLAKQGVRFPLINVLVQSQYILGYQAPELPGLTITDCSVENLTSKVDITFNFKQAADGIKGAIEYNSNIFKRATIHQFIANLRHICSVVSANENGVIDTIKLLETAEDKKEEEGFRQMMLDVK